jgi:alanyl-tRNA synthetase
VRVQIDRVRQKLGSVAVVLAVAEEGKATLYVALTPDLVKKGLKAGEIIKPLAEAVGGRGGGKPDYAQAGGKEPSRLPEALAQATTLLRSALV